MKKINYIILLLPCLIFSQKRFDYIRDKLQENKKYEFIYPFENNIAVFRTFNNTMGIIDSLENEIIKPIYNFLDNRKELKNLIEVGHKISKNKSFKRGYIDLKGTIRIPIEYDYLYYENGLIRVEKNNFNGIIDTLNNKILPLIYDNVDIRGNLIITYKQELLDIFDFKGKKLNTNSFSNIIQYKNDKLIVINPNKTNSIIDEKGKLITNSIKDYSFVDFFSNNLYLIQNKKSFKFGVSNEKNEIIIPCKYETLREINNFYIVYSNKKYGIISKNNSVIKPFIYDEIFSYGDDDPVIFGDLRIDENYMVKIGNKYGIINPFLNEDVIPVEFKNIKVIFDKYYKVQDFDNKSCIYSKNGKKITQNDYKFYTFFDNSIFASKKGKNLIIKLENDSFTENEVLVDEFINHSEIVLTHEIKYQIFKKDNKYGVINNKNSILIPNDYDFMDNIYESNEFIVKKNNKYGVVNTENKIIVNLEYDDFKLFKEIIKFYTNKKNTFYYNVKFR